MIKRLLLSAFTALLFSALLSSCKKENLTQAQLTEKELTAVAKQNNIIRIYALKNNAVTPGQFNSNAGMNWAFSNGFFKYTYNSQYSYNLAYLVAYDIVNARMDNNSTDRVMLLYFQ